MPHSALKRIGISIPAPVLKDLQAFVPERKRSEYIVKAIQEKINGEKKQQLRKSMIEGYQVNSAADAESAEAWRSLEEEAELLIGVRESKKNYGRKSGGAAKKR